MADGTIRVLLVDHQEMVRRGLAQMLTTDPEIVIAGESTAVRGPTPSKAVAALSPASYSATIDRICAG